MYESAAEIANLTSSDKFDAALAIHLYKGGRLLQGNPPLLCNENTSQKRPAREENESQLLQMAGNV